MIHFYSNNYNMEFFKNSHVELIRYDNIVMANHNVFIDYFNVSKTEKKKSFILRQMLNIVHSFSFGTKLHF